MATTVHQQRRRRAAGRAFTLLELLLALVLAVMIAAAVAMAVDLHLRAFDSTRSGVEEARLARAVVQLVSDDLRSAIRYDPLDIGSMVPEVPMTEELGALLGDAGETAAAATTASSDAEGSLDSQSVPGLYGGPDWLQVDVSRLPRIDQFQQYLAQTGGQSPVEAPSDVKTVIYWVIDPSGNTSAPAGMPRGITTSFEEGTQPTGGLMRLEMSRARARFAASQGALADLQDSLEPIAPEVLGVAFQYYDGAEWFDSWDSTDKGGLPVAVRVEMAIVRSDAARNLDATTNRLSSAANAASQDAIIYRVLVHIPAARPTYEGAEETTAGGSQSLTGVGTTGGGTSGGGTSGGGTSGGGTSGGGTSGGGTSGGGTPGGGASGGGTRGGGNSGGGSSRGGSDRDDNRR